MTPKQKHNLQQFNTSIDPDLAKAMKIMAAEINVPLYRLVEDSFRLYMASYKKEGKSCKKA